ncbi:ankyrin repeat-containing domain protein, partial [Baffinella frigidus]
PIHSAAEHGDCEVLQALIAAKAYPSYQDKDGMTPLHYAVQNEHTQASILLLESSGHAEVTCMVKACSKHFNRTPLHEACMFSAKNAMENAVDVANVLIAHGAVVDCAAASQYTALHMAAMHGNLGMVVLLLESGANLFLQNLGGFTPL